VHQNYTVDSQRLQ